MSVFTRTLGLPQYAHGPYYVTFNYNATGTAGQLGLPWQAVVSKGAWENTSGTVLVGITAATDTKQDAWLLADALISADVGEPPPDADQW